MLLLSAEMDDGMGLLVTTRSHGKTAAQLLQRVFTPEYLYLRPYLWERAAQNGHVSLLQWLRHNSPALSEHEWHGIGRLAAQRGQVVVLKWVSSCQPKYVFAIAHGHVRVHVHVVRVNVCAVMPFPHVFVLIRM